MSKKASVRFNFPATKNVFLSVLKPDDAFGNEVYQTTLIYDKDTAEKLRQQIEGLDASFKGLCKYKERDDGTCEFKVKQNRFIRWIDRANERQEIEMKPKVLNLDNTEYTGTEPWGGTIAEVGAVVETQAGAQKRGTILALRLRGIRIHELVTGGAGEGDGDPMFGGAVAASPKGESSEVQTDDLPFDVEPEDDDCPI